MNTDQLFASIALLIDLAQKGEIDPWDVQVIEVIDRYLIKLLANQETAPPQLTKRTCRSQDKLFYQHRC